MQGCDRYGEGIFNLACDEKTWVVISAISALSALSTSSSTVYSTTRPVPLLLVLLGLPLLWVSFKGLGGIGRIWRTVLVQRRLPPLRVVKYALMPGLTWPMSASETSAHTVMGDSLAMRRISGVCCCALRVWPTRASTATTVPVIGA